VLAAPVTPTLSVPELVPDGSYIEWSEPFGRLQADGSYCAVNCPDEGYE